MGSAKTITVGLAQLNSELGDNAANLRAGGGVTSTGPPRRVATWSCSRSSTCRATARTISSSTSPSRSLVRQRRGWKCLRGERDLYIVMGMGRLEDVLPSSGLQLALLRRAGGSARLLRQGPSRHLPPLHRRRLFRARAARPGLRHTFRPGQPADLLRLLVPGADPHLRREGLAPQPRHLRWAQWLRRPLEDDAARPLDGERLPFGLLQYRRATKGFLLLRWK